MLHELIYPTFQIMGLQQTVFWIAAAAGGVVLILILLFLLWLFSRNRNKREADIRGRLVAMEREQQFAVAADHTPHLKDPSKVADDIEALLRDYLFMTTLAIYAGRDDGDKLTNLLSGAQVSEEGQQGFGASSMPNSLPASVMQEFVHPRVMTGLGLLVGPDAFERVPDTGPLPDIAETPPDQISDQAVNQTTEGGEPPEATLKKVEPALPDVREFGNIVVWPWRGSFNWSGLIVARARESLGVESLGSYGDAIARLGNKLAVALELSGETNALDSIDERLSRVNSFDQSVISALNDHAPLQAVMREVSALVGADSAALWRVEDEESMLKMAAAYGLRSSEFLPLPRGQGLAGSIAESGQPLALDDAPSDPRCLFPREAKESGITSYLGVPIIAEGHTLGVVEAHTTKNRSWTRDDLAALERAASVIAELLKVTDAQGSKLRVESAYLGVSEAMQQLQTPDEVMEAAVEVLGHALGVSRAIVVEFDEGRRPAPVKHEYLAHDVKPASGIVFNQEMSRRLSSAVAGSEPLAINDSEVRSLMENDVVETLQVRSEMAVPIRQDGEIQAIVYLHQCDRKRQWQLEEVEFADRVSRQLSLSLAGVRALEAGREQARRAGESSERAQGVINALPNALIGFDREGRLNFFNSVAHDWLGLQGRHLGQPAGAIESLAMQDASLWHRVISSRNPAHFEGRLSSHTNQGAEADSSADQSEGVPVSVSVSPMRNSRGETGNYLVMISDVGHIAATRSEPEGWEAERNRLMEDEARVRRSAQQLLEINRLKSEFIVNAGRELESSLQSVLGISELLEQGTYGKLSSDQTEAVRNIYTWARRMKNDIDWLIEYGSARSRRLDQPGGEDTRGQ